MTPLSYHVQEFVVLASLLFCIGGAGFLLRRNVLIQLMCIELMLNASNLAFVAFGRYHELLGTKNFLPFNGQIFVFFVIAVAAAEVAVGLALIVEIFKTKKNINIDEMNSLKG